MIDKPLESIEFEDIDRFVQERWPEGKTLDYKRDNYGGKDEDKKELLKDVSSFANTQGGDILIGIDEDKGIPTESRPVFRASRSPIRTKKNCGWRASSATA